jgi:hypothetical protein
MRALVTMTAAAMVLTGCGAQLAPNAALAPRTAAQAASAGTYFDVFPAEPHGQTEVSEAARGFIAQKKPSLPLGPNGEAERVTGMLIQDLAARHAAGGRKEFVGKAIFQGTHVPNTYVTHEQTLPFKMTLDANDRLVSFDFEKVSLAGLPIARPAFKAMSAADAARVEADVLAFLKADPAVNGGEHDTLFGALLGKSQSYTAKIEGVKATTGAFGYYGRAFQLEVPFRNQAGGIFYTYTVFALAGKDGQLVQVR